MFWAFLSLIFVVFKGLLIQSRLTLYPLPQPLECWGCRCAASQQTGFTFNLSRSLLRCYNVEKTSWFPSIVERESDFLHNLHIIQLINYSGATLNQAVSPCAWARCWSLEAGHFRTFLAQCIRQWQNLGFCIYPSVFLWCSFCLQGWAYLTLSLPLFLLSRPQRCSL